MAFLTGAIVSTVIGSISLYIACTVTHTRISWVKVILIAFLAQLILPFIFSYLSGIIAFLPFSNFLLRLFVWVSLVKFMAQRISIMKAVLLGTFAFGISYFITLLNLGSIIRMVLPF